MHQKWFHTVDNDRNYYFVITVGATKVGVVDLKDIDPAARTAEVGIYFCHDGKIGGLIPYETMIAMLDFGFERLGLTNIRAHIVKTNTRSIHFSLSLGSQLDPGQENVENQSYSLYRDRYIEKSATMRELIARDNKPAVKFQLGTIAAASS
jgi:RimJ/RimL family protein N-acetyltransferase